MNKTKYIAMSILLVAAVLFIPAMLKTAAAEMGALPAPAIQAAGFHLKIDRQVIRLIQSVDAQNAPTDVFRRASPDVAGGKIRVVVEALEVSGTRSVSAMMVRQRITAAGGQVELAYENLYQSLIPLDAVEQVAASPFVKRVRLPFHPILHEVTSEGVNRIGADYLTDIPPFHAGRKVKVGVLDAAFKGYRSLLGSELPSQVTAQSFRADGNLENPYGNETYDVHGTACAEIIYDLMPDAEFFLTNIYTDVEHHAAVSWLIQNQVDVISCSLGWTNAGAGDGTGPICYDVERVHSAGIFWANAAGNEATDHWEGTFNDPDSDGWHNFSGSTQVLSFTVNAYTPVFLYMNWDDWGTWTGMDYTGSTQDYDLYLYIKYGATWFPVDSSQQIQNGNQWPTEEIVDGWYSSSGQTWGVAIRKKSASRSVKLEIFFSGNNSAVEFNVPEGSLTIPADSPYAIAAGSTGAFDDGYHYYSSRGPTSDGRIKPDFMAPSGVSTASYGSLGFYGTSASAPHMAGVIALLLGKTPYSDQQILNILQKRAVDLGPTGPDSQYGYGRVNLRE